MSARRLLVATALPTAKPEGEDGIVCRYVLAPLFDTAGDLRATARRGDGSEIEAPSALSPRPASSSAN